MSIILPGAAGRLVAPPLLLNLYFGPRTSATTAGEEEEPLTGGDMSTLSQSGVWNSTELLSNLHIFGFFFSFFTTK